MIYKESFFQFLKDKFRKPVVFSDYKQRVVKELDRYVKTILTENGTGYNCK